MSPWGVDYIFILVARSQTALRKDFASSGATNPHVSRKLDGQRPKRRTARDLHLLDDSGYGSDHNLCLQTRASFVARQYRHGPSEQTGDRTSQMGRVASHPPHRNNPSHKRGVLLALRTRVAPPIPARRSPRPRIIWICPHDSSMNVFPAHQAIPSERTTTWHQTAQNEPSYALR